MPRKPDANAKYRLSIHKLGNYLYAGTQPPQVDPETGKTVYRHKHWGRLVGENKLFKPNKDFLLLTPEERQRFIFPSDWDLSELKTLSGFRVAGHPVQKRTGDRLYGDIWLLEKVAEQIGLRADLMTVFDGDKEKVDAIMTLAIFPYLSGMSFNRAARWQRIARAPFDTPLTPDFITRLTQSISTLHRDELFRLRAARLPQNALCAVDSTTRGAYGNSLSNTKWGESKDRPDLPQTNEVVVYDLVSHMPIFYRSLPGNMPDCRSFKTILQELDRADFPNVTLITDRGYSTTENLETVMLKDRTMLTAVSTTRKLISDRIKAYGEFSTKPASMRLDRQRELYYEQFDQPYTLKTKKGTEKVIETFKINLYLNLKERARLILEQEIEIENQRDMLNDMLAGQEKIDDEDEFKKGVTYFKYKLKDGQLTSFELNAAKVKREKQRFGFFSSITLGMTDDAPAALRKYAMRDEQEKYFQHMKSQMGYKLQANWSEDGRQGRDFILFVGLTLASQIRKTWKTTDLKDKFDSSLAVLDEMRCIRIIEETGKASKMTPFVGAQVEICKAFGIDVPAESAPGYTSKRVVKRGPRAKSKTKADS